jgi:hypothetical protein
VPTVIEKEMNEMEYRQFAYDNKDQIMWDKQKDMNEDEFRGNKVLAMKRWNLLRKTLKAQDDVKKIRKIHIFKEVAKFGAGKSFGELALMNSKPRYLEILILGRQQLKHPKILISQF